MQSPARIRKGVTASPPNPLQQAGLQASETKSVKASIGARAKDGVRYPKSFACLPQMFDCKSWRVSSDYKDARVGSEEFDKSPLQPFAQIPPSLAPQRDRKRRHSQGNSASGKVEVPGGSQIPNLAKNIFQHRLLELRRSMATQKRNQSSLGAACDRRARKYNESDRAFHQIIEDNKSNRTMRTRPRSNLQVAIK